MIIASRIELLKQRALLVQAKLGVSLLEDKLISLMELLRKLTRQLKTTWNTLLINDRDAVEAISLAKSREGLILDTLISAKTHQFELEFETEVISGFAIPILPATAIQNEKEREIYPLTIDSSVDACSIEFENLFTKILQYVDEICVLQKLSNEIRRVRRQVANLESIIIPQLLKNIEDIQFILNEREMEDATRLRKFKAFKANQSY